MSNIRTGGQNRSVKDYRRFYTTCFRNFVLKNRNISFDLPNFMVYKYKIVWSMSYQNVFCN